MKKQKQKLYAYKSSGKMSGIYWNDVAQAERQTGLDTQQLIKTSENGALTKWRENKANTGSRWVEFLHMTSKNVNKITCYITPTDNSLTLGVFAFSTCYFAFLQHSIQKIN